MPMDFVNQNAPSPRVRKMRLVSMKAVPRFVHAMLGTNSLGQNVWISMGAVAALARMGWFVPMWQHLGMVTSVAIAPMATKAPETSALLIITTIAPTTLAGPAALAPMKASTASRVPVTKDTLGAVFKMRVPWITVTIVRPGFVGLAARVPMKG
tara:strand:+ start:960 stop:1421 length:462 start_codon:yes stop_codon:yes gene_type:complete